MIDLAHTTLDIIGKAVETTNEELLVLLPSPEAGFGFVVAFANPAALQRWHLSPAAQYQPIMFFNQQQCLRLRQMLTSSPQEWQKQEYEEVATEGHLQRHYITQLLPVTLEACAAVVCVRRHLPMLEDMRQQMLTQMEGLRSIVQSSNNSLIYLKPDYTIVTANQTAQDNLFARTGRHYLTGTSMLDYIDAEEAQEGINMLREMEKNMEVVYYERQVAYPGGDRWFQRKFYPTFDLAGQYNGFVIASTEITSLKQQMEQVERQNQQLREIAIMQSHETRRPLANILSLIHLLESDFERLPADGQSREHLQLLRESTEQLDQVVRRIVHSTRMA